MSFSRLGRQRIVADFDGHRLTSDAEGLLLRAADHQPGLTAGPAGTELAKPRVTPIRSKPFKIAVHAMFYHDGDMIDLSPFFPPELPTTRAVGINNYGWIIGYGDDFGRV